MKELIIEYIAFAESELREHRAALQETLIPVHKAGELPYHGTEILAFKQRLGHKLETILASTRTPVTDEHLNLKNILDMVYEGYVHKYICTDTEASLN